MTSKPNSALTTDRPDIWRRGLALATGLTGYEYAPKTPLADGTIFACGYGGNYSIPSPYVPPPPKTPEQIRKEKIDHIDSEISWRRRKIKDFKIEIGKLEKSIKDYEDEIGGLEKERASLLAAPAVFVPEGAMEWLLHEVGHWVAATATERALPDYGIPVDLAYDDETQIKTTGFGYDREWQAWAFEEIVLAPFGPARMFAAPSHRGGVGYSKHDIPGTAFTHIESQLRAQKIDVTEWRNVWADWVAWGLAHGDSAPWKSSI